MNTIENFITRMPKVELHVHLEGSVQPQTLLKLAKRHNVALPADDVEGLRQWYTFRDFNHFIDIYMQISSCLRTAEDIELITREFLVNQAEQNILYSEVTFTPYNQFANNQLGFHEQIDAVNRARAWGERELGVRMGIIMDIPRLITPEEGDIIAGWVIEGYGNGVIALGLGGPELDNPPEKFKTASATAAGQFIGGQVQWTSNFLNPGESRLFKYQVTVDKGREVVNDQYVVRCVEGVWDEGAPVVTQVIGKGGPSFIYLPVVLRNSI